MNAAAADAIATISALFAGAVLRLRAKRPDIFQGMDE